MYYQFQSIYQADQHTNKTVMKIENGIISALYDDAEFASLHASADEVIQIHGHAYPGFNDSHMHLVGTGKKLADFNATACKSIEEFQNTLREYIEQHVTSPEQWILGRGWNQDVFADGRLPQRSDLDAISTEIPIAIHRVCGHIAVLNTAALQKCGFLKIREEMAKPSAAGDSETESIDEKRLAQAREMGGDLDMEDGRLTGIVREIALNLLPITYSDETIRNYILNAQDYLFSLGITSVQSDDLYFSADWRNVVRLFREMEADGTLKIRVYEQSQIPKADELTREYQQDKSGEDKRFKCGPLKMLSDGSLGARTAYMSEPYADDPNTRGMLTVPESTLIEMMKAAAASGTDSAIHSIGDGSLQILLHENKILRESGYQGRNTIVHSQIMTWKQIEQMAELGVGAMVQPIFLDYDLGIVESRVGAEKAKSSYAYRSMLDKGIRLSFGSDSPVENPCPRTGIYFALHRKRGGERELQPDKEAVTLEEAIRCYTEDGAYFSYEEQVKGQLKPGFFADFTVLSQKLTPQNLLETEVLATAVGGEIVFQK